MSQSDTDHGDRRRVNDVLARSGIQDDTSGHLSSDGDKYRRRRERPVDSYLSRAGNTGNEQYESRHIQHTSDIDVQTQRAAARNGIAANSNEKPSKEDILFDKNSGITRIPAQRQRRHSVQLGGAGPSYRVIPFNSFDKRGIYKDCLSTALDDTSRSSRDKNSAPHPRHTKTGLDGYKSDTDILYSHLRKAAQPSSTGLAAQPNNVMNQDRTKVRNVSDPKPMNSIQSQEDILFDKRSGITRIPAQRQRRHSVQFGGSGNICGITSLRPSENSTVKNNNIKDHFSKINFEHTPKPGRQLVGSSARVADGYVSDTEVLYSHLKKSHQSSPVLTPAAVTGRRRVRDYIPEHHLKTSNNVSHPTSTREDILVDKTSEVVQIPAQRQRSHSVQFGGKENIYGAVPGTQFDRENISNVFKDIQDRFLERNYQDTAKSVMPRYTPPTRSQDGYSSDTDILYSHLKRAYQANQSFSVDKLPRHRVRENVPQHHTRDNKETSDRHSQNKEDILFDKSSGVTRIPAQRQRRHSIQFGTSGNTWGRSSLSSFEQSARSNLRDKILEQMNSVPRKPLNVDDITSVPLLRTSALVDGHVSDTDLLYSHIKKKYQSKNPANNSLGNNKQHTTGTIKAKVNSADPVSALKEDILFDRSSGVTRVPAQRLRRHSVQFGGSGNICGTVSGNTFNLSHISAHSDVKKHVGKETLRSNSVGPGLSNNLLNDMHDGYSSDSEFLRSHLKNVSHQNMGVAKTEGQRRTSLGSQDSDVRHGTAIFIRRPSISSLTLEKDSYVRDAEGRAFRKSDSKIETDGTTSDTEGDAYIKRNIHVRRHSISTPTLRAPFTLREAPAPKILRDFQNWENPSDHLSRTTASNQQTSSSCSEPLATAGGPVRRYSVTYAPSVDTSDSESPQDKVRSKTYLTAPTHSGSHRRTRRRRCRPLSIVKEDISPVSATEEHPHSAFLNGMSTNENDTRGPPDVVTTEPQRSTINISRNPGRRNSDTDIQIRGENNVNIMATGNVNISVNTTQPITMVGNNTSTNSGNFALWTPRTDPRQVTGYTPGLTAHDAVGVGQSGYPLGMWRQGNVLVDSVCPMVNGHSLTNGGRVMYPGYPWSQPQYATPMMLVPCHPQALYPGNVSNTPYPQIEDKSVCTPLTVDTGSAPGNGPAKRPDSFHGDHGTPAKAGLLTAADHQQDSIGVQPRGVASQQVPGSRQKWQESSKQSTMRNGNATQGQGNSHANHSEATATHSQNNNDTTDINDPETEEQCNIKDIIANFEERRKSSGGSVSMPQFGTAYKKPDMKPSGNRTKGNTDPGENSVDATYELDVEKSEGWVTSPEITNNDPTKLHAYIAEMSISEVRYGDTDEKNN